MIVSVDGLTGFGDAINAVFPQAEIQRCIVHQIRYTTKFVNYKDLKPFVKDLKEVYQAATEEIALQDLDEFEKNGVRNMHLLLLHGETTGHSYLHISSIHKKSER